MYCFSLFLLLFLVFGWDVKGGGDWCTDDWFWDLFRVGRLVLRC